MGPPRGDPLRGVRRVADHAIAELHDAARRIDPSLCHALQPPVLRGLLLQAIQAVASERLLCERVASDGPSRWFVEPDDAPWTPEWFSVQRARLFASGIAPSFFQCVLKHDGIATLVIDDRLAIDATLLEAWAGQRGWQTQDPGSARELASLLVLPRVVNAERYFAYLDDRDGQVPLDLVLRRLQAGLTGRVAIGCWSEVMARQLANCRALRDVELVPLEPGARLAQLVSVATHLSTSHVALVEPGAALLPLPLVRRLCEHHLRHLNDVTRVAGLPEGARVEIYSTWCLRRLRLQAPKTVDFTPGEWLDWVAGVESRRSRLEDLRCVPFPEPVPQDLPARVTIEEPADWRRVTAHLEHAAGQEQPEDWSLLNAWRTTDARLPVAKRRPISRIKSRGPRVLFLSPSVAFSGSERMFVNLTTGLLESNTDLWGLVVRPGMTAALLRPEHRARLIADGIEFGRPTLASFDYCLNVFRRVRPDLIHVNGFQSWPVLAAAAVCRVPIVQHLRIVELAGGEEQLRRSDLLIAVSKFTAAEAVRAGADPDRVRVCYDGIDTGHFRRTDARRHAARRRLGIAPQTFVVLCIARCTRMKRIELVIRALAELATPKLDALLLIVGDIEDPLYFESLKEIIAAHDLESRVRFLSGVEDIRGVHAAADAVVPGVEERTARYGSPRSDGDADAGRRGEVRRDLGGRRRVMWHARRRGLARRLREDAPPGGPWRRRVDGKGSPRPRRRASPVRARRSCPGDSTVLSRSRRLKLAVLSHAQQNFHRQLIEPLVVEPALRDRGAVERA